MIMDSIEVTLTLEEVDMIECALEYYANADLSDFELNLSDEIQDKLTEARNSRC